MPTIRKTLRVYNFIEGYIRSNGEPPTLKEICNHFGFNSPAAAHEHVEKMIERGWITRVPHVSRGIQITGKAPQMRAGKRCIDGRCERAGETLPYSEFYTRSRSTDGYSPYCKKCTIRSAKERYRRRKQDRSGESVIDRSQLAFSLVYDAIKAGKKTREEIQLETKLDYDSIGEALSELVFECKAVRIEKREFHLAA